jgi:hypothetical protein
MAKKPNLPNSTPPRQPNVDLPIDPMEMGAKPTSNTKNTPLIDPGHPMNSAKKSERKRLSKKQWIIIVIIMVLLSGVAAGAYFWLKRSPDQPAPVALKEAEKSPEPPKLLPSSLTGVEVEPEKATTPVMASIIENLSGPNAARPQSGLSSAGVVYEALAEGGITRYLAIWQLDTPTDIGPVRSLRPVFYNAAMEYQTPTAHAGGSADGIALARGGNGFRDLDEFLNSGGWFRRVNTRYAPHNLYITGEKLRALVEKKGWATPTTFTGWVRKSDQPAETPNATTITVAFSSPDYQAVFAYDKASNSYLRSIGGKPDTDVAANGKQVSPKSVVVLSTVTTYGKQANGKPKTDIVTIGSGKGYIFQDGTVTEVTWQKKSASDRMVFLGPDNQPIALNRGQTWVSVVPTNFPPTWK